MSRKKIDRTFPSEIRVFSDETLSKIIAFSLRQDFGCGESAVKKIGRKTGTNLRAVRNWYEARNTASTKHFVALIQISPTLKNWVLEDILMGDLRLGLGSFFKEKSTSKNVKLSALIQSWITDISTDTNVGNHVPRNVPIKNLGVRQKWFLVQLRQGRKVSAQDLAIHFNVKIRTAERDIAELKRMSLVTFVGRTKGGNYQPSPEKEN